MASIFFGYREHLQTEFKVKKATPMEKPMEPKKQNPPTRTKVEKPKESEEAREERMRKEKEERERQERRRKLEEGMQKAKTQIDPSAQKRAYKEHHERDAGHLQARNFMIFRGVENMKFFNI